MDAEDKTYYVSLLYPRASTYRWCLMTYRDDSGKQVLTLEVSALLEKNSGFPFSCLARVMRKSGQAHKSGMWLGKGNGISGNGPLAPLVSSLSTVL